MCVEWPFHFSRTVGYWVGGVAAVGVAIQNTYRMVMTGSAWQKK
ncbi:hypothetical protein ACFL6T_05900 [Candidatus Zixiibacteriota bacterium]